MASSLQQRREQEQTFIRGRLETISEVRSEIETKREIVNKQFADELHKALNYLQEAEDFKVVGDNFNAYRLLEKAKSLARKTLLQYETLSLLDLENWCWHPGNKKPTDQVVSLWKVYIDPSFDLPALLCAVHFENHIDGIFCIGASEETVSTTGIHASFPKNWIDIVVQLSINCLT